jgi:hypothetical protein
MIHRLSTNALLSFESSPTTGLLARRSEELPIQADSLVPAEGLVARLDDSVGNSATSKLLCLLWVISQFSSVYELPILFLTGCNRAGR